MLIFLAEDCKYSFNSMFDFIVKNKSIPTRLKYKKAIIVQNKKNIKKISSHLPFYDNLVFLDRWN